MKKLVIGAGVGLLAVLSAASIVGTAYAAGPGRGEGRFGQPGVMGTVSAISGSTFTVSGRGLGRNAASSTETYTVNAASARVVKNGSTSSVSAIAVGDKVFVRGTVSGTNVAATLIRDGAAKPENGRNWSNQTSSLIQGNGQPVIAGAISAISGDTITVSTKSGISYVVAASGAKVVDGKNQTSLSNLAVGDTVIVQGSVNGTQVTASSIIVQKAIVQNSTTQPAQKQLGFFGRVGQFFLRLFGF
jgi:co-chaperonin GroES (HSP10)